MDTTPFYNAEEDSCMNHAEVSIIIIMIIIIMIIIIIIITIITINDNEHRPFF
eukprot:COSAG06_NODE_1814_length_8303_cov_3.907972_9_plen_53_part_00